MDGNIGPAITVVKQRDAPIVTTKINPNQVKNTTVPSMNTSQVYGVMSVPKYTRRLDFTTGKRLTDRGE